MIYNSQKCKIRQTLGVRITQSWLYMIFLSTKKESEKTKLALGPIANKLINNDNFKQSLFLYVFLVLKYRKWFPFRTVVAAKRTSQGRNRLPDKRSFISHLKVVYLGNDKRVKGCG